jgi:hypothetical protein
MPMHRPQRMLLCVLAATVCLWRPAGAAAQAIAGRVVDAATGAGIARARVVVVGPRTDTVAPTLTDDTGRFVVVVPSAGRYRVQAAGAPYEVRLPTQVSVCGRDTARTTLRLRDRALQLSTVTATVRGRRIPVKGRFRVSPEPPLPSDRPAAAAGERSIVVHGKLPTPTFCYRLAGGAARSGRTLTVLVEARPDGDLCGASVGTAFRYDVNVKRLQPGTYNLRVLHSLRHAPAEPTLTLDTTVIVP